MLRTAAILALVLSLNPLVANSEPAQPNKTTLEYETSNNQVELLASSPAETPNTTRGDGTVYHTEMTGYSSTPDQTDDTPFITASGTHVRPGVAASNWLPLGTRFQIPDVFGERIFVIEDRMHTRFQDRVDIWFPDRESAILFGRQNAKIVVL